MDISIELSPILVVDDDKKLVAKQVESFEDKSIQADRAHTAREALAVLRGRNAGYYKAALIDIDMETPEAGLDILGDIRQHDPHLPIIYLSAYVKDDRVVDAISKGAVQMLMKPVPFPALYYCLMSVVHFAKLQRKARELVIEITNKKLVINKLFNHNMKNLAAAGQLYLQTNPPAVDQARLCFDAIQDQTRRIMAMSTEPGERDVAELTAVKTAVVDELAANPQVSQEAMSRITFTLDKGLPPLHIKPETLSAVLGELIYNAIVHNGTRAVHVSVSAQATPTHVQIRVEDDGMGVPADRQKTMFQVEPDRKEHGFGLPYCYEVLRIHGGDIRYEPVSPTGGAFVFTVPSHTAVERGHGNA